MPSLPSCFSKSSLASPICRKLKRINGALSNLAFEVLMLAALACSLAMLQESPVLALLELSSPHFDDVKSGRCQAQVPA